MARLASFSLTALWLSLSAQTFAAPTDSQPGFYYCDTGAYDNILLGQQKNSLMVRRLEGEILTLDLAASQAGGLVYNFATRVGNWTLDASVVRGAETITATETHGGEPDEHICVKVKASVNSQWSYAVSCENKSTQMVMDQFLSELRAINPSAHIESEGSSTVGYDKDTDTISLYVYVMDFTSDDTQEWPGHSIFRANLKKSGTNCEFEKIELVETFM